MTLRESGCRGEILMLAPVWESSSIRLLAKADVALSLSGREHQRAVEGALAGRRLRIHLALDSGMHRYGYGQAEISRLDLPQNLTAEGIYTHFAAPGKETVTRRQYAAFTAMVKELGQKGIHPPLLHCCATGAFFRYGEMHGSLVRLGSALVGCAPGLEPVWKLEVPICAVRDIPAGESVGYGAKRLHRPVRAAILSLGHCDGLLLQRYTPSLWGRLRQKPPVQAYYNDIPLPILGGAGSGHMAVDMTGLSPLPGDMIRLVTNPLLLSERIKRIYE